MYDLPIPEQPADRSVVLDRETKAWQRQGERWYQAGGAAGATRDRGIGGSGSRTWTELLISKGPLAAMIAESAIDDAACPCGVPHGPEGGVAEAAGPVGCDSPSVTGEDATNEHPRPQVETAWGDSLGAELRGQGFGPDRHGRPGARRPGTPRSVADRPQA